MRVDRLAGLFIVPQIRLIILWVYAQNVFFILGLPCGCPTHSGIIQTPPETPLPDLALYLMIRPL